MFALVLLLSLCEPVTIRPMAEVPAYWRCEVGMRPVVSFASGPAPQTPLWPGPVVLDYPGFRLVIGPEPAGFRDWPYRDWPILKVP